MSSPFKHRAAGSVDLEGPTRVPGSDEGASASDGLGGRTQLAPGGYHERLVADDLGGPNSDVTVLAPPERLERLAQLDPARTTDQNPVTVLVPPEQVAQLAQLDPAPATDRKPVTGAPAEAARRADPGLAAGAADDASPVPRTIGAYPVTGPIASGSMGVVYKGEHPTLHRPVAIKVMHPHLQQDPAVVARFFAEAVATSRINHPNVVSFFDFGYDARGAAYLVIELLEGETLSRRLTRERRLDIATALDIAIQIGLALEAAHAQGVVHRDLKPDNIFLCAGRDGASAPTVKLLDFGVSKVDGHSLGTITHIGDLLGTPSYMAPEQGLSASDSDARSDLYSVGCVLFEMVCGVRLFAGNMAETLAAHQTSKRPAARVLNPEIPPALDVLIYRLIARDPAARPGSVSEVVRALSSIKVDARFAIGASTLRVRRGTLRPRAGTELVDGRFARPAAPRRRWRVVAAQIALVLAIGIVIGALIAQH